MTTIKLNQWKTTKKEFRVKEHLQVEYYNEHT